MNFFFSTFTYMHFVPLVLVNSHAGKYISYSARHFSIVVDAIQRVALSKGRKIPIIYG